MTTTLPERTASPEARARGLISTQEFLAVSHTIRREDAEMTQTQAEHILTEALKFVATGALFPARGMRPSRAVDLGWHALILHTAIYADLCHRLGRFVHHRPSSPSDGAALSLSLDQTQALMAEAGYAPDPLMWLRPGDGAIMSENPPCCDWCDPSKPRPAPKQG